MFLQMYSEKPFHATYVCIYMHKNNFSFRVILDLQVIDYSYLIT